MEEAAHLILIPEKQKYNQSETIIVKTFSNYFIVVPQTTICIL